MMKNLLNTNKSENVNFSTKFIRGLETKRFWNPNSLETIIFNSFVGAAVIFRFKDGSEKQVMWQNHSRRESWTPEMREAARQKALAVNKAKRKERNE